MLKSTSDTRHDQKQTDQDPFRNGQRGGCRAADRRGSPIPRSQSPSADGPPPAALDRPESREAARPARSTGTREGRARPNHSSAPRNASRVRTAKNGFAARSSEAVNSGIVSGWVPPLARAVSRTACARRANTSSRGSRSIASSRTVARVIPPTFDCARPACRSVSTNRNNSRAAYRRSAGLKNQASSAAPRSPVPSDTVFKSTTPAPARCVSEASNTRRRPVYARLMASSATHEVAHVRQVGDAEHATLSHSPGVAFGGRRIGRGHWVSRLREKRHALGSTWPSAPLCQPHRPRDVGEADDSCVEIDGAPVRLRGPCQVFLLLCEAGKRPSRPRQRLGSGAIAVSKLSGLPIARGISELLRLRQRIRAAVDVFEPVDERSSESKKRVRPVRPELGGLSKRGDGVRELLLRLDGLPPRLAGFAVDPVQVSIAVPERGFEPPGWSHADRARERFACQSPLRLSDRRQRRPIVVDDAVAEHAGLLSERLPQADHADSPASPAERIVLGPRLWRFRPVSRVGTVAARFRARAATLISLQALTSASRRSAVRRSGRRERIALTAPDGAGGCATRWLD